MEPLIETRTSKLRKVIAQYWQRWPRTLFVLGAFVYVSLLLICIPDTSATSKLQEFSTREQFQTQSVAIDQTHNQAKLRHFQCVAWRATSKCRPNGPRLSQNDKNCSEVIVNDESGYCEIEDVNSGERFHVMRRYCNGLKHNVPFRCSSAPDFANFHIEGYTAVEKTRIPGFSLPNTVGSSRAQRDGIVMVVYPKLLPSAYATIRVLRNVLNCKLPIEIWFHVDEINGDYAQLAPLQRLAVNVRGISFHPMYNPNAKGFLSKIFAIYNSHFDRVLFLDADNVPVRDPTFLFSTREFIMNGAVFWPDFWHPRRTLFNLHARSMLWELIDTPFKDMFEQESGQLLIDRTRHAAPLELVYFYAFHRPNFFEKLELVYGDKDLFRLAWLKLEAPYHMIKAVPAMAGRSINGSFCGMTMVQHDAEGEVLFLHRNQHKLTGMENEYNAGIGAPQSDEYPDLVIWTHLLSFRNNTNTNLYLIDAYRAAPEFPQSQPCYGKRNVENQKLFELQDITRMSFAGIEADIRHFAFEAARIRQSREVQWVGEYPNNSAQGIVFR
ncbi:hypothetical protein PHMEG_00034164 [Phytophthora megakarya]|uniref:Uncharacterized protein n=1 Tax=Phytophthora megakarya TaxID=4795 RepID=A0A225URY2_9STRA|nr:hypothetical protein PHMEG_00034164 [Phytophthora megakarya]